ncbi:hypothetical protein Nmel_013998 [Mimus melanotis]
MLRYSLFLKCILHNTTGTKNRVKQVAGTTAISQTNAAAE